GLGIDRDQSRAAATHVLAAVPERVVAGLIAQENGVAHDRGGVAGKVAGHTGPRLDLIFPDQGAILRFHGVEIAGEVGEIHDPVGARGSRRNVAAGGEHPLGLELRGVVRVDSCFALVTPVVQILAAHGPVFRQCNRRCHNQESRSAKDNPSHCIRIKNPHDASSISMTSTRPDAERIFRMSCCPQPACSWQREACRPCRLTRALTQLNAIRFCLPMALMLPWSERRFRYASVIGGSYGGPSPPTILIPKAWKKSTRHKLQCAQLR